MMPVARDVKHFVPTQDLGLSIDFYTALGWTANWRVDGLAELELAGHRLFLQGYYAKEWAENSMLHITVDDAAAWYERAKVVVEDPRFAGTRAAPPARQSHGDLVCFVHDPCGVLLHFAQPAPARVVRPAPRARRRRRA